jgi:hypothetical protein
MDENTLSPNGYNMLPGGRGKIDTLPEDLQRFGSLNRRKHTEYDLPPGVSEIKLPERGEYGFKVFVGEQTHDFISKHEAMEEKFLCAMECYNIVKSGGKYHRPNNHKWDKAVLDELGLDAPEGIKYRKDKIGFEVHVKLAGTTYRKTFTKKKFTLADNLDQAIAHLNNLKLQHPN